MYLLVSAVPFDIPTIQWYTYDYGGIKVLGFWNVEMEIIIFTFKIQLYIQSISASPSPSPSDSVCSSP